MRTACLILSLASLAAGCSPRVAEPAAPVTVALPAPKTDGAFPVEKALKERRSIRDLAPTPLKLEEIGQLCWAAQGVSDDKGHRTAPSAMATYPLELRVLAGAVEGLEPGLYRYEPAQHALALLESGNKISAFREKAVGQDWIAAAPAILVVSGAAGKMAKMKDRGAHFMWAEAGLAAQGFFLQATALGLGSTYVGGFDPQAARAALGLPDSQEVLAVLPVGRPAK